MEAARTHSVVPKLAAIAAVAIILVAGAVVLVVFAPPKNGSKTSSPQTGSSSLGSGVASAATESARWTTCNSTTSSDGLQVQAWLNTTTLPVGRVLAATVFLFNTLATNVTVTPDFSANTGLVALSGDTYCRGAGLVSMLNFGLYQGRYTAANISQASAPLKLDPPAGMDCPNPYGVSSYVHQVQFAPRSYNATLTDNASYAKSAGIPQTLEMHMSPATGGCNVGPDRVGPAVVIENNSTTTIPSQTELAWGCDVYGTGNTGLNGYWTLPANGSDVSMNWQSNATLLNSFAVLGTYFHQFSPGAYTLVGEDLWNQTVFAHFEVVPPEPVEVLSVTGPIPPFNPGGPVIEVAVKNTGDVPIVSLNASLRFVPPTLLQPNAMLPSSYSFELGVNASNPLLPGLSALETRTLIGGGFDDGEPYPLAITGTLANGTEFYYVLDVQVMPP